MRLLWALAYLSLCRAGQPPRHIKGIAYYPINVTATYNKSEVKEITWKREIDEHRKLIAKVRNNSLLENDGDKYEHYDNGITLNIRNLTKNDGGLYIADATYLNNEAKEEEMYLDVLDHILKPRIIVESTKAPSNITPHSSVHPHTEKKTIRDYLSTIIPGALLFGAVLAILLRKYIKRSLKSREKGGNYKEGQRLVMERSNNVEDLEIPVENSNNQDEGQMVDNEMEEKEQEKKDEYKKSTVCVQETSELYEELQIRVTGEQKNDRHEMRERLSIPVAETHLHRVWRPFLERNNLKKTTRDEHLHELTMRRLQDTKASRVFGANRDRNRLRKPKRDEEDKTLYGLTINLHNKVDQDEQMLKDKSQDQDMEEHVTHIEEADDQNYC
ncbi:uncharacterized protein [Engystomops pustulosus]|uniref:uncharacterized protein isoform X2 n=1 Tax=Engystomops pustulosus TaxID=76066 RepID=UPI003AFA94A6